MLGWIFCRGALYGWKHTLGWLFQNLANHLDFHVFGHRFGAGSILRDLDNAIIHRLGAWANGSEHAMGYCFHAAAWVIEWATYETAKLAQNTFHFGEWLLTKWLPHYAKYAVYSALPPVLIGKWIYDAIRKDHAKILRWIEATIPIGIGSITLPRLRSLERELEELRKWLSKHKGMAGLLGAVGGGLALPVLELFPAIRDIQRWVRLHAKRLHRLEALLGAAGFAVAMANALGLPNWRCITRGNLGRVSRALCGLDKVLLDAFLLDGLTILAATDLCDLSFAITEVAEAFQPILYEFVDVEQVLVGCHGNTSPGDRALPRLVLPPVQTQYALSL